MKRTFAVLLILCLLIAQIPFPTYAAEIIESGDCGAEEDFLPWTLTADGILTVSGTGKMWDYAFAIGPSTQWTKDKIKKVVIEEGVSYIGDEAFKDCPNLQSVVIADSVTEIGLRAFANCDSLTDVYLGCGLKETSVEVFLDCDALKEFTFPNTDTFYGNHFLAQCDSLKNVVIPEKMTRIGYNMFSGCTNLESITIPDTVTFLGGGAFSYTAIKTITIPDSIINIESYTFEGCKYLESVTFPNTLKSLENQVFSGCPSLKEITIPASVTKMAHTFEMALGLERITFLGNAPIAGGNLFGSITASVYYPANNPSWTENVRQNYAGTVTWVPYECDPIWDEVIISGSCGDAVTWKLTNTWTLIVSGDGAMRLNAASGDWYDYATRIEHIVIEQGVTTIAPNAFTDCAIAQSITIADTVTTIGISSFSNCAKVNELAIPNSVTQIDSHAFAGMAGLKYIRFLGDAPIIDEDAFRDVVAEASYLEGNTTWTEDKRVNYGGKLTWYESGHVHDYQAVTVAAKCNEQGYYANLCNSCGNLEILSYIDPLGHDFSNAICGEQPHCAREDCDYQDMAVEEHEWDDLCSQIRHCVKCGIEDHNGGHSWDKDPAPIRGCIVCGKMDGGYRLYLDMNVGNVFIDGVEYFTFFGIHGPCVDIPTNTATTMVIYSYNKNTEKDSAPYPVGMKVWRLSCEGEYYTATYIPEFENLLQYAGSSIRITGTKGIRMITSITKANKTALTGTGLAGYRLVEYGTLLAWRSFVATNSPLILGQSYSKSNFAYKRGVADPIFAQTDTVVQYTNVLVGFNLDQCKDDIAMRPYIILEDASGTQITIYGGIVYRSIGYIAYQNRNAFQAGTSSYHYVWEIIQHVYGSTYNPEFKG